MFAKLLKHEWKANRGLLGLLTLAVLGVGVMAAVMTRVLVNYGDVLAESRNLVLNMLLMSMGMSLLFIGIAVVLYAVGVQFVLLYRFYRHKFTDEGYLTFTLPVSATQIFWSSFVNMFLWLVISVVAVAAVALMVILFGTATEGLVNVDALKLVWKFLSEALALDWQMMIEEILGSGAAGTLVLLALETMVSPVYALVVPMASITLGAVLAKKHKILAAIGVYYGLNMVVSIASSLASILPSIFFVAAGDPGSYMFLMNLLTLGLTVAITLGGYFLTIYLMRHKLNLP